METENQGQVCGSVANHSQEVIEQFEDLIKALRSFVGRSTFEEVKAANGVLVQRLTSFFPTFLKAQAAGLVFPPDALACIQSIKTKISCAFNEGVTKDVIYDDILALVVDLTIVKRQLSDIWSQSSHQQVSQVQPDNSAGVSHASPSLVSHARKRKRTDMSNAECSSSNSGNMSNQDINQPQGHGVKQYSSLSAFRRGEISKCDKIIERVEHRVSLCSEIFKLVSERRDKLSAIPTLSNDQTADCSVKYDYNTDILTSENFYANIVNMAQKVIQSKQSPTSNVSESQMHTSKTDSAQDINEDYVSMSRVQQHEPGMPGNNANHAVVADNSGLSSSGYDIAMPNHSSVYFGQDRLNVMPALDSSTGSGGQGNSYQASSVWPRPSHDANSAQDTNKDYVSMSRVQQHEPGMPGNNANHAVVADNSGLSSSGYDIAMPNHSSVYFGQDRLNVMPALDSSTGSAQQGNDAGFSKMPPPPPYEHCGPSTSWQPW